MTTSLRKAVGLTVSGTCVSLAASVGLSAPSAAADPADIGNTCLGFFSPNDLTVVMTATSDENPLPITPVARGVITRAKFNVPGLGGQTYPTTLKTVRATGVANEYMVVAQSDPLPIADGARSFDVRVPIAPGDLLGLTSRPQTLVCGTNAAADVIAIAAGDQQPGQTATFGPATNYALPVVATVEPDVDGDGFGDDTQDDCVRSAALQTACPVIRLDSFAAAQQRSILVAVSTSHPARVAVTGTAKVNGKKVKLQGGTRAVQPVSLGRFTVRYPKAIKAVLAALPPGKSIKVRLTASTTDALGQVTTDRSSVRIPRSRG